MAPAKTNSVCKRVKDSRKSNPLTPINQNNNAAENGITIEDQEILHLSSEQPLIDTVHQPSLLLSQFVNRSTPALSKHFSSSFLPS
jgi:RNase adaptor protein for sRNA GlmZ degradation